MEPSTQPDLEESVKEVMKALPPPVREFLSNGSYTIVARELTTKHGLHIDQGGILEREIMLLLMGTEETSDFIEALVNEAKIPQQVVEDIINEMNQRIFIPLQEEIRKGFETFGKQSSAPSIPFHTSQQSASATAPKPPTPQTQLQQAILAAQKPSDEKLLEDREEPHIEFKKPPVLSVPPRMPVPPPSNFPGAPIPPGVRFSPIAPKVESTIKPAAVIPPTPPTSSAPTIQAKPVSPIPPPASVPPASPIAPAPVSYTTDPYREPIDEKKP